MRDGARPKTVTRTRGRMTTNMHRVCFAPIAAVLISVPVARKLPFPIQPKAVTVLMQPA